MVNFFEVPPEIRILSTGDLDAFKELVAVLAEVFELNEFIPPADAHLSKVLNTPGFYAAVATVNERIIGGLTVYTLHQYVSEKPLAYLYDLGVLASFQRVGVGSQLVAFARHFLANLGYEELFVQADRVDAHAVDFYRKTHPSAEEDVLHFYYLL